MQYKSHFLKLTGQILFSLCFICQSVHAKVELTQHEQGNTYILKVSGELREDTAEEFKRIIEEIKSTKKKLHLDMVQFNSPGGSGTVGVEISRIIRSEGLNTYVSPDAICNSACTYAFIGGIQRYAFGKFGIHNTTFTDGTEVKRKYVPKIVDKNIQFVTDFVREMRLSSHYATAMLDTPSWTVRYLTDEEKFAWGVNGTDRPESDVQLLEIAKERGMKSGDFSRIVDQHYRSCHQQTVKLKQTVWECLKTRNEDVPIWKRIRKWVKEIMN